jgi:hypothetical protein
MDPRDRTRRGGNRFGLLPRSERRNPFVRVTPGALLATFCGCSRHWFKVYVQNFSNYIAVHGTRGAIIVLLLWFYRLGSRCSPARNSTRRSIRLCPRALAATRRAEEDRPGCRQHWVGRSVVAPPRRTYKPRVSQRCLLRLRTLLGINPERGHKGADSIDIARMSRIPALIPAVSIT